jgi:hypothetical protein
VKSPWTAAEKILVSAESLSSTTAMVLQSRILLSTSRDSSMASMPNESGPFAPVGRVGRSCVTNLKTLSIRAPPTPYRKLKMAATSRSKLAQSTARW